MCCSCSSRGLLIVTVVMNTYLSMIVSVSDRVTNFFFGKPNLPIVDTVCPRCLNDCPTGENVFWQMGRFFVVVIIGADNRRTPAPA